MRPRPFFRPVFHKILTINNLTQSLSDIRVPTHNYQKGFNGNLLFYCLLDRLVYLTIFCTEVLRYHVTVLSLDLMFTHTHSLLKMASRGILSRFNQTVEMKYAQEETVP